MVFPFDSRIVSTLFLIAGGFYGVSIRISLAVFVKAGEEICERFLGFLTHEEYLLPRRNFNL
jgi:hypothetical protein